MGAMETPLVPIPPKRKYHRGQPTVKQIKAIQNINQGMSVRKALIEAGYSIKTANKSTAFFKHKGVQNAIMSLKLELQNIGISNKYLSQKFAEWLEAKKIHTSHTEPDREVPDYDTQIKAYDRLKDIWNADEVKTGSQVKRKLTITEFVNGTSDENNTTNQE